MNDKNYYRKNCKLIRANLDSNLYSKKIVSIIKSWDIFIQAKNIMLFYPINNEISLLDLLKDDSKNFYFPVVAGKTMYPVAYSENSGFCTGAFGIKVPIGEKFEDFSIFDLIFVPGLAVDNYGYRIGYGKGYYDRFLKKISNKCVKAIPIHSNLLFEKLPSEKHDVYCDFIVTEKQILASTNQF